MWETVPQPSCDTFAHGGPNGYLDLFIRDSGAPAKQWKYTNAPDADARAIQAAYWALTWAKEQGKESEIAATVAKAAKMGDYLRYAMFDKYFKKIGNCVGASTCAGGHRQGLGALPACPGTTPGAARPTRPPAGRGGSAPATTTSATRTRSRPGR